MAATSNHDAKLLQMQLEALGGDRREHIVTTRFKEEEHPVPVPPPRNAAVRNLSSSDADAGGQATKLSAWFSAFEHLKEDVKHERHLEDIGTGIGQSHRHKLQPGPASGPPHRGENVSGRSPHFRRARPAAIKPEVIRIGGRNTQVPSRGAPHHASSSAVRARGRDASLSMKVSIPTKSSKSPKVNEAHKKPTAVDPFQRRERRSHTQVVDLCKPADFLAFSGLATGNKVIGTKKEASLPPNLPAAPPASREESRPVSLAPSPKQPSERILEASNTTQTTYESSVMLSAVDSQQANVSPIANSSPIHRLSAGVNNPSEPDVERSFTREGLLRFLPRLREELPKDLFAQVEAFVHAEEEEDRPSGDQNVTVPKDSESVTRGSSSSTTPSRAGTLTTQNPRDLGSPSKIITKTKAESSKGADALPGPSAPLSIVEDDGSIEQPSAQGTNAAAALLGPRPPVHQLKDRAQMRRGITVDSPSMVANSIDLKATGFPQKTQQPTVHSGRQSLAQSLMRQRDALIGEHVHKSRFSHTTASLEKQFAKLRISETNASQGISPTTLEVSSSASNVASYRKGPTLPKFLQEIQRQSDPGAAARNQYSGNIEPRTSTDPIGSRPETSRRESTLSISSTADPSSFPPSRINPRTGEGPELPEFLRPGAFQLGSQVATHAPPVVPGRVPLKENQNPFARRPTNPNVGTGSTSLRPLASMANTNTSIRSSRTKPRGPDVPNFLQEALAAQKKNGAKY